MEKNGFNYQKLNALGKALVEVIPNLSTGGYCYDAGLAVRTNLGLELKIGALVEKGKLIPQCFNKSGEYCLDISNFPKIIIEKSSNGKYIENKEIEEDFIKTLNQIERDFPGHISGLQKLISEKYKHFLNE